MARWRRWPSCSPMPSSWPSRCRSRVLITPLGGFLFGTGSARSLVDDRRDPGRRCRLPGRAHRLAAISSVPAPATTLARARGGLSSRDSVQLSAVPAAGAGLSLLAGQHRAGAARHAVSTAYALGDVDRHHSRQRSSMPSLGAGFGMLTRSRRDAESRRDLRRRASCCRLLGLAVLALVPVVYTRLRPAARQGADRSLTPDVCVIGGGAGGLVGRRGRGAARARGRADRARADGRRLPQLRLRAVKALLAAAQHGAGATPRGRPSASTPRRAQGRLRRGDGPRRGA